MKQDWETRTVPKGEIRAIPSGGDSPTKLECRAIVYNSWSTDLGGFRERMLPGSAELSDDLVGLFDHDTAHVLGRVSAGTMEATRDNAGVNGSAALARGLGWLGSRLQTGQLGTYVVVFVLGALAVLGALMKVR